MDELFVFDRLGDVGLRRKRCAVRVRMVCPKDRPPADTCFSKGGKVIRGIDEKPAARLPGDIASGTDLFDRAALPDEEPAALVRRRPARMLENGVPGSSREAELFDHTRSTIMAVPMPPPTHSDAAP